MSCTVSLVSTSVCPLHAGISSAPPSVVTHPQTEEDFFLPCETPLDKEIHQAVIDKIIDRCCVLNPEIKIDRDIVIQCLNACINHELDARQVSPNLTLRSILLFAIRADDIQLPIEFFSFVGSSVIFKLADAIIKALEASEAKSLVTPLFIANLKRIPHDSDWKISVQSPPKDSKISFWDNIEKYTRAILRGVARKHYGRELPDSFDIPAISKELNIYYDHSPGQFIHISFLECGIDLTIGSFAKEGLFKDTLPEATVKPDSITENPETLIAELDDSLVNIFQAAIYRGCKVLAVINSANKNDRAAVQFIRRSLTGDASFSEKDYSDFMDTLFKIYPVSSTWARDIAKKFCNINKGHSDDPIKRIVWSLFLLLCSLKNFPQYSVSDTQKSDVWEFLPVAFDLNEVNKLELVKQDPSYQFMQEYHFQSDVLEAVIGIAGFLSLYFISDCSSAAFSFSRHKGVDKLALCYTVDDEIQLKLDPDLLTFCRSIKTRCADNPLYMGSPLSHKLLDLFIQYAGLKEGIFTAESVLERNAKKLPTIYSEVGEIAVGFILSEDPLLNLLGATILVSLKAYDPLLVNESLLSYVFPLLLSSTEEKVKTFATLLAKKYLSQLAGKEAPPFLHPKTKAFSLPLWLNAIALTNHPRCCEIAAKHWTLNVPTEKKYFQAYLTFMGNLWKGYPLSLIKVWEGMLPHSFEATEQEQIFLLYADKLLDLPENDLALDCLEPFIHFINSCLKNLTSEKHGSKLHELLQRASSLRPNLVPYCIHWLSLLPEEAVPLFKQGTVIEILQEKIAQVQTLEDKNALAAFLLENILLKDIYFTLESPLLSKALDETEHLSTIYQIFLLKPSHCALQKGRIFLKLLDIAPDISYFKTNTTTHLKTLIRLNYIPLKLILLTFKKCYHPSLALESFLWKPLCLLIKKLLVNRLNPLTPFAAFVCKQSALRIGQKKELFLELLRRIIHENEPNALQIAFELATHLKSLEVTSLSGWESILQMFKTVAYRETPQNLNQLSELSRTFPELSPFSNQVDLEILAHSISPVSDKCFGYAENLIKKVTTLYEPQQMQLKGIIRRMVDHLVVHRPVEALHWLKSSYVIENVEERIRIEFMCKYLQKAFNAPLCHTVFQYIEKKKDKNNLSIARFLSYLIGSPYLFEGCDTLLSKVERLIVIKDLEEASFGLSLTQHAGLILQDLVQLKDFDHAMKLLEDVIAGNKLTPEICVSLVALFEAIPQRYSVLSKRLLNFTCALGGELTISLWAIMIAKALAQNDSTLLAKVLSAWIAHYPFPCIEEMDACSTAELDLHFKVLCAIIPNHPTLAKGYLQHADSLVHVLSLHPQDSKVLEIRSFVVTQLAKEEKDDQTHIIKEIYCDLEKENDLKQLIRPAFRLLLKEMKKGNDTFVNDKFAKLLREINKYSKSLEKQEFLVEKEDFRRILQLETKSISDFLNTFMTCCKDYNTFKEDLITFLLNIRGLILIPPSDPLWLTVLKWSITTTNGDFVSALSIREPNKKLTSFLREIFNKLLPKVTHALYTSSLLALVHVLIKPFDNTFSKTLLDQYRDYFATNYFEVFFGQLIEISAHKPILITSVKYWSENKLLSEEDARDYLFLIIDKIYSNALNQNSPEPIIEAYKTYVNTLPHFYLNQELDTKCALMAINAFIKLFKLKYDPAKLTDQVYTLTTYCFCDITKKEFLNSASTLNAANKTLTHTDMQFPSNYENFRAVHLNKLFAELLFQNAQDLDEKRYDLLIRALSMCLSICLLRIKKFKVAVDDLLDIKNLLIKFILFPRHKNPNNLKIHFEFSLFFVLQLKDSKLFEEETVSALELYVRILDKDYDCDQTKFVLNVKTLLDLLIGHSEYSFISFYEDLFRHFEHTKGNLTIEERLDLFTNIIHACKKIPALPTLRYIYIKKAYDLIAFIGFYPKASSNAFKVNFDGHEDHVRLSHINFLIFFIKEFIAHSQNMHALKMEERSHEIKEYFKTCQHSVMTDNLTVIYNDTRYPSIVTLLITGSWNSVAFEFENPANFPVFWAKYREIALLLIQINNDILSTKKAPLQIFWRELFFKIAILAPDSKWLKHNDPAITEEQIQLAIRAFEFELMSYDEGDPNIVALQRKVQEIAYLQKVDFYRHFSPENYPLIPLLFLDFQTPDTSLLEIEVNDANNDFGNEHNHFSVLHCCYLADKLKLTPQELEPLRLLIWQTVYWNLNIKDFKVAYQVIETAFITSILIPYKNEDDPLLLRVLNNFLNLPEEYFLSALAYSVKLGWFNLERLDNEKKQLLISYFTSSLGKTTTTLPTTLNSLLKAYFLMNCSENNFEQHHWTLILLENFLSPQETTSLWISAILSAMKYDNLLWAVFFVSKISDQKDLHSASSIISSVFVRFFLKVKSSLLDNPFFHKVLNSPSLIFLIQENPTRLRKALSLFFKIHLEKLSTEEFKHTIPLLNLYADTLFSLLNKSQKLPENLIEKDFKNIIQLLNALYVLPSKSVEIKNWVDDFLNSINEKAPSKFIPELILGFLLGCKTTSNLAKLSFFAPNLFYELVLRYAKETSSEFACKLLTFCGWLYPSVDPSQQKAMVYCCLFSIQTALSEGYIKEALAVIDSYYDYLKGAFEISYIPEEYTPALSSIRLILLREGYFKNAHQIQNILLKFSAKSVNNDDKIELYQVVKAHRDYVLAGALACDLAESDIQEIGALIEDIISTDDHSTPTFMSLIRLFETFDIIDLKLINSFAQYCKELNFLHTLALIGFLEGVEKKKRLTEITFLLPLWIKALESLHRHKKGYLLNLLSSSDKFVIAEEYCPIPPADQYALILLATLRTSISIEEKCKYYWAFRFKISIKDESSILVQNVDEEFKYHLKEVKEKDTRFCYRVLLLLERIYDGNTPISVNVSEILMIFILRSLEYFELKLVDSVGQSIHHLLPHLHSKHRDIALVFLLKTRLPKLTSLAIAQLTLISGQHVKNPSPEYKKVLQKLPLHINDFSSFSASFAEIEKALVKDSSLLNEKEKNQIYVKIARRYFSLIPAETFIKDYINYLKWLLRHSKKVLSYFPSKIKLITDMCSSYNDKIPENSQLLEYIPKFISETTSSLLSSPSKLSEESHNSLKFNLRHAIWNYAGGGYFGMMLYFARSLRTKNMSCKEEILKFIFNHQAFQAKHPLYIKNTNANCFFIVCCVLAVLDPTNHEMLGKIVLPLISQNPLKTLFEKDHALHFQLCFILAKGKIKTHETISKYHFELTDAKKNLSILNLANRIIETTLCPELFLMLEMLIEYQNEAGTFQKDNNSVWLLLENILFTIKSKNFFEEYIDGTMIRLFDFMELFFSKNHSKIYNRISLALEELYDEDINAHALFEIIILKIMVLTTSQECVVGDKYDFKLLIIEYAKELKILLNESISLSLDLLETRYVEASKILNITLKELNDLTFEQEIIEFFPHEFQKHLNFSQTPL